MERFVPILDSAKKVKTPLEACFVLNEHLKGIMKYGHTGLPFYPTIDETYRSGISQCEGLCNLGTFYNESLWHSGYSRTDDLD